MIKPTQFFLVLLGCIWIFSACSKKGTMEVDNETQSAVDYSIADQEFMSLIPSIIESASHTKGASVNGGFGTSFCDTLAFISGDTSDFNPNLVFNQNISSAKCSWLNADSKERSGKITLRLTGKINSTSAQAIIKLNNYVASGIEYACDSIILKFIAGTSNKLDFSIKLINGSCKTTTNNIKFNFERTVTIYPKGESGNSAGVCYFYGSAGGTNRLGIKFSTSIQQENALVKHNNCMFIERGIMELTPEGFKTREINFGDGNCDNEATFTVNENTVAFKLK